MFASDGAGCGAPSPGAPQGGAGERPSTINVMPCRLTTWGNISIKLEDYPLPVVLMARSSGGNSIVDLPVTIRVKGRSPSAPVQPYEAAAAYVPAPVQTATTRKPRRNRSGGMETEGGRVMPDRLLDAFGAGVAPKNAERVPVDDPSVTAWMLDGHLYLRGPVTVINPAQDAEAESVGGMKVWRFDRPVPRVYVVDETGAERALTVQF
jgi:intracellular multiplication protein IcmK